MDRRRFLKRGLFGGALLTASGLGLALYPGGGTHRPKRALRFLDERSFAIFAAIAARVMDGAPNVDPAELAHRLDDMLLPLAPEVRGDILKLLPLFDNALAGLILDRRLTPFTRLSPEAQDEALAAWRSSKLVLRRGGYAALRKLSQSAYYFSPDSWEGVGYPGPPEIAEDG